MESHMMLMAEGFCFMQPLRLVFAEIGKLLLILPQHTQNIFPRQTIHVDFAKGQ